MLALTTGSLTQLSPLVADIGAFSALATGRYLPARAGAAGPGTLTSRHTLAALPP